MDAFCRLCSSESQYYLNIFGDEKFGNTLNYEVINYAYNLQIQVDDELSKYVCLDCTLRIREFKQWKSMAHAVQLKLLEIHRQLQVKKEAEDCSGSNDSKESCANGDEFHDEGVEYHNEGDEFHEEGDEFHGEGDELNNKGNEFHSEVIIKQEVEESSPYVEESDCSNENGLTVKQGNELQSEVMDNKLQFVTSNRGRRKLILSGYTYHFQRKGKNNSSQWMCQEREICNARLILSEDEKFMSFVSKHSHSPRFDEAKAEIAIAKFKEKVKSDPYLTPSVLTQELLANVDSETIQVLPSQESLKRKIRRLRNSLGFSTPREKLSLRSSWLPCDSV